MRTFVLYSRAFTGAFNLNDLPSSGHRMDIVARCVNAALFLSFALRHDTRFYVTLNGPPDPPKTLLFDGSRLTAVSPDERNIASWILKANALPLRGREWTPVQRGMKVAKKSFQEVVRELRGPFYVLDKGGKDLRHETVGQNPVFILGDRDDVPKNDLKFVQRYRPVRVSVGRASYLASHCIVVVNNELDRRGI